MHFEGFGISRQQHPYKVEVKKAVAAAKSLTEMVVKAQTHIFQAIIGTTKITTISTRTTTSAATAMNSPVAVGVSL